HINKNAYYFVLDPQTGKPLIPVNETPVPQSAEAHTYPTQPIPQNTSQELVPHVPIDPQNWSGAIAPDGKPYIVSTVPYQPYTDPQYVSYRRRPAAGSSGRIRRSARAPGSSTSAPTCRASPSRLRRRPTSTR